jgi:hypothetical protein
LTLRISSQGLRYSEDRDFDCQGFDGFKFAGSAAAKPGHNPQQAGPSQIQSSHISGQAKPSGGGSKLGEAFFGKANASGPPKSKPLPAAAAAGGGGAANDRQVNGSKKRKVESDSESVRPPSPGAKRKPEGRLRTCSR